MDRVEKYIQDFTRGCSNELSTVEYSDGRKVTEYHEWLTPDNARAIAQIAREEIEIPFGAKDSELIEETYYIPQGMEAIIEDDKVIIRRKERRK